jgi:signal transduction histidine kinase
MLVLGYVVALVLAVVAVQLYRRVREQARERLALLAELERERERAAELAVLEERAKIARELHDVVAHGLSVIALQAGGAETALPDEPERARTPLRAIRREAEEALAEMRRALGLLRPPGDGEPDLSPQPGLAQLPALVERARVAGMPVTLHIDGHPRPVDPGLELSAYRIVQEALANVHKHAGGAPASVRVAWGAHALVLRIRDTGMRTPGSAEDADGHGLIGMRERVRAHGGEFAAGRVPGGGFEVTAELPL